MLLKTKVTTISLKEKNGILIAEAAELTIMTEEKQSFVIIFFSSSRDHKSNGCELNLHVSCKSAAFL